MMDVQLTNNSKAVTNGAIFAAISGTNSDGHNYIRQALEAGAAYIIAQKYPEELGIETFRLLSQYEDNSPTIASFIINWQDREVIWDVVINSRLSYAKWAHQLHPAQPEYTVAVTGTNGKTSTAWFYQQILSLIGEGSAALGTIGVVTNVSCKLNCSLTTPDALDLHKLLEHFTESGVKYLSMEASSHALHQNRLSAVEIKAAAFTNFTQDHLDYHHDMDEYFQAKTILFNEILPAGGHAILNVDMDRFSEILQVCTTRGHNIITYGHAADISYRKATGKLFLKIFDAEYKTDFHVVGDFQIYNLMAAIGLLLAVGITADKIISVIPNLLAPTGRMELVSTYNNARIYVDYAHTPDALQRALEALRSNIQGRVHVLFGCGGNRDKEKRQLMGEIAHQLADVVIITDDNPRLEDASTIRAEIMKACPKGFDIADRAQAIKLALQNLRPHDILLVAGKGHETYQIIGTEKHYFSDHDQVLLYVREMHRESQAMGN